MDVFRAGILSVGDATPTYGLAGIRIEGCDLGRDVVRRGCNPDLPSGRLGRPLGLNR